jgi:hypothetical protein
MFTDFFKQQASIIHHPDKNPNQATIGLTQHQVHYLALDQKGKKACTTSISFIIIIIISSVRLSLLRLKVIYQLVASPTKNQVGRRLFATIDSVPF